MKIEDLQRVLIAQLDDLDSEQIDYSQGGSTIEREGNYSIDDTDIKIQVIMKKTRSEPRVPEGAAFCGGKFGSDIAVVQIINDRSRLVENAVKEFFKLKQPAAFPQPPCPRFEKVTINGVNFDSWGRN